MQGWVLSGGVMVMVIFCRTPLQNECLLIAKQQSETSTRNVPYLKRIFSRANFRVTSALLAMADVGSLGHNLGGPEQVVHMDEMVHGWVNTQREEQEPTEDFLNDENEPGNRETGIQDVW
ncbi:hypothetical protein IFM89_021415 [Coptis chinensis]|uniref:Uncharacterized protein n=1 Tax=Coptis chinensis TaxID=261450 RepID=A0A835LYZ9_9MAGN|nr:hypothetical protein IFM89_021415 [Coptis chinensis]